MSDSADNIARAIILIVDDVSSDRHLLTEILMRQGYEVHAMVSDDATARVIEELSPDLVVLDCIHSAVIERFKVQEMQDVPILFSGAMDAGMDRGRVFIAGGADYLLKPFQAEEVLARVETHLALRSLQRQVVEKSAQVQQEVEHRQYTEASLQDMNEVLERRIIERTATLRASEAMFRYLLARANDGYVIVNDQEQVVYANVQARVYLGLGQEINPEAAPFFRELVVKQYRCEPQAAWAQWPKKMFINKLPVPLYLVRPETPVSNVFWLQVEMLDIAAGLDTEAGRIICINDVTEKTALQDELNRFHSVISHKLRTPLVPLYTGLMFLVEQVRTMSRDDIMMFVQNAYEGAENLYNEIEEIVQYMGAPRTAPPGSAFRIADFEALVAGISDDLSLRHVTVSIAESLVDASLPPSRWSIELIMWEILENSKKFHPRHAPTVSIGVSRFGVQQIRIQVIDDGLTLSPEQLVRMWMPYYQADKYSTGQVAGMGLGLSLVVTQVWGVGGTCRSYNREDGPGIVVELILPCTA